MVKYFCDSCGKETTSLFPTKLGIGWHTAAGPSKDPLILEGGQSCSECALAFGSFSEGCRSKVFASVQTHLAAQLITWKKSREKFVVGVDHGVPGGDKSATVVMTSVGPATLAEGVSIV